MCSARTVSPSVSAVPLVKKIISKKAATPVLKQKPVKPKPLPKEIISKDTKSKIDTNKLSEETAETKLSDEIIAKDEKIEKIEKEIKMIEKESGVESIIADIEKIEKIEADVKKATHKSKFDMKNVKSRVDSRAPSKSIERKKGLDRKIESSSPPTTPKKNLLNGSATKAEKTKPAPRVKTSPSGTPAKSAKDANNRKVVEARVISRAAPAKTATTRPVKKEETPPQPITAQAVAAAPTTAKPSERKPISRRAKPSGAPTTRSATKSDTLSRKVIKKLPIDLMDKASTDSTVSTPSADVDTFAKPKAVERRVKRAHEPKTDVGEKEEVKTDSAPVDVDNVETDTKAVNEKDIVNGVVEKEPLQIKLSHDSTKSAEEGEEEEYLTVTKEEPVEEIIKDSEVEILQEEVEAKDETEGEGEIKKLQMDEQDSEKKRKNLQEEITVDLGQDGGATVQENEGDVVAKEDEEDLERAEEDQEEEGKQTAEDREEKKRVEQDSDGSPVDKKDTHPKSDGQRVGETDEVADVKETGSYLVLFLPTLINLKCQVFIWILVIHFFF